MTREPVSHAHEFSAFYRDEYPRAVQLAFLLCHCNSVGEEIVQDVFIKMHDRFRSIENPSAYLRTSVVNSCRTWNRRNRTVPFVADGVQVVVHQREEYVDLINALADLKYRERAIVVLRYWGGYSERDVSAALGIRLGTVKSASNRALKKMKGRLEK